MWSIGFAHLSPIAINCQGRKLRFESRPQSSVRTAVQDLGCRVAYRASGTIAAPKSSGRSKVSDETIAPLGELTALRRLEVSGTAISEACRKSRRPFPPGRSRGMKIASKVVRCDKLPMPTNVDSISKTANGYQNHCVRGEHIGRPAVLDSQLSWTPVCMRKQYPKMRSVDFCISAVVFSPATIGPVAARTK